MFLGEVDGGRNRMSDLIRRLGSGLPERRDPHVTKPGQSPHFDFAEDGVFVGEMSVEGAYAKAGAPGDGVAVDALCAMAGKEAQAR
jgi:hypothetical protein